MKPWTSNKHSLVCIAKSFSVSEVEMKMEFVGVSLGAGGAVLTKGAPQCLGRNGNAVISPVPTRRYEAL